jgi:hypothetical protein
MSLLILWLVASAIFGLGWVIGSALGYQAGRDDAYKAIQRWQDRQDAKRSTR